MIDPTARLSGESRAAADVATGVANLRAAIDNAPDWADEYNADGRTRRVVPAKALLVGHLRRIERLAAGTETT